LGEIFMVCSLTWVHPLNILKIKVLGGTKDEEAFASLDDFSCAGIVGSLRRGGEFITGGRDNGQYYRESPKHGIVSV
jgi:hypothetical protein